MKYFVIFFAMAGFLMTPCLVLEISALCMINEDWSDAPCFSGIRGEDPSLNQMKQNWAPYYEFKGAEWMEVKKQELMQTIQNGNLIDWKKGDLDGSHHNVYMYYFLKGDVPNEDGLFAEEYYGITFLSPLHQRESGITLNNIRCGLDLSLIQKYDGPPACVKPETKDKLVDRGWAKDDSVSKINASCMTIEQSKQIAPFFQTPTYLPKEYSHVCSRSGMPFESYLIYYNQAFPNTWQIPELVSNGAIFIYQIDERNMLGDKKFQTYGSPEQRIQETYDSVMKGNPSLSPQLITINGMLAYAVDSCPDCGMQIANFTDGSSIQKSTSTETKIKFIDENGVNYMLETTLPLSELIKVAESLQ